MEVLEFIGTLFSILTTIIAPFLVFGMFAIIFIKALKKIQTTERPNRGERTLIQQDDRVIMIYKIRKDDPDFNANEIEQYIKNYTKEHYPKLIFRTSSFNIVDYQKANNTAQIMYSILATNNLNQDIEYKVVLEMNIEGTDAMKNYTKECINCGAVIEDENATSCPYCGQTYKFQKYNKWKVKYAEVID